MDASALEVAAMQGRSGREGVGSDVMIETLADKLEADLGRLEACWSEIPDEERGSVIVRIGSNAPGVARLLCPQFGRFTALMAAGKPV